VTDLAGIWITPLRFEHPGDASRAAEVAAVDFENFANFTSSPVSILRQDLAQDCDAIRSVTFVQNLVVGFGFEVAGPLLDRPVDGVVGHRCLFGAVDRITQGQVRSGIAPAASRGHDDVSCELAEELASLLINEALFERDVRPVGMSGHGL